MRVEQLKKWMTACAAVLALAARGAPGGQAPPDYGFEWAVVGDVGNEAYDGRHELFGPGSSLTAGRGAVAYRYRISKTEIATEDWVEFLNFAAPLFEYGFFPSPGMGAIEFAPNFYVYWPGIPQEQAERMPVIGVSWREAAMYCNWLHNDKERTLGALMSGAYDVSTFGENEDGGFTDQATHSPDARFWIPTLDEWLKAAHYDPDRYGPGQGGWWAYSHTSDTAPVPGPPGDGETSADDFLPQGGERFITLGAYPDVMTPWGLLDTSGGGAEWTETVYSDRSRAVDGGVVGLEGNSFLFDRIDGLTGADPDNHAFTSLRLASVVPAPGSLAVVVLGCCCSISSRRKRCGSRTDSLV